MCGRYTLSHPGELLQEIGVSTHEEIAPRYNIAPTQEAPIVRGDKGERELVWLRWGLVPYWAKDPAIGNRMINARGETAAEKPSFRVALQKRRCLVLVDGFYEWKKVEGEDGKAIKQPYHIHRKDRRAFTFAGLWERWNKGEEGPLETFTIITTEANETMTPLHHRMPVILEPELLDLWLDPEMQDRAKLTSLLRPAAEDLLEATAVSRLVNNPRNESPRCIEPLSAEGS